MIDGFFRDSLVANNVALELGNEVSQLIDGSSKGLMHLMNGFTPLFH